ALNDIKNLQTAINAAKAAKKENPNVEAQVAMSYTTGPVFTTQYYVDYAKRIEEAGADSICIKDMAALLTPYYTEELVKAIKGAVKIPVQIHTHYTSGLASMCLLKGIEAGADRIDTAMSPLANGTSHAPTESMVAALQGTEYDTGIDLVKLSEIREYFMKLREKYIKSGLLDPKMLATDAKALIYQVPGGMLSNLLKQLKDAGKSDKLTEVLEEVPRVRKDSGYPPLVTPTSQIVGTQAVFNVILGERYKMCNGQFKDLVAGKYGTTPVPIDPEFRKKIIGDQKPVECRPADLLEPELEKLRAEIPQWIEQEEDVLTYAQFPEVAPKFFKARRDKKVGINPDADIKNKVHPV
ncbi:MAG: pyruvate carboxylase subunit B, partial [Clostridia bacterium]|nr:pyruvate carboxylase subunit B [Clostridia bacterium]